MKRKKKTKDAIKNTAGNIKDTVDKDTEIAKDKFEHSADNVKKTITELNEEAKHELRHKEQEVKAEAKAIYTSFLDQFWLYTGVIFCVVAITYYYYYQNPTVNTYTAVTPQPEHRKLEKEPIRVENTILRERNVVKSVPLGEQEETEQSAMFPAKKNQ